MRFNTGKNFTGGIIETKFSDINGKFNGLRLELHIAEAYKGILSLSMSNGNNQIYFSVCKIFKIHSNWVLFDQSI